MTFGEKLRVWRKSKGYTQDSLSSEAGVHSSWISNLERNFSACTKSGEAKPSRELVTRLAEVLEVDLDEMLLAAGFAPTNETLPAEIRSVSFEGLNEQDLTEIVDFIRYKRLQRQIAENPDLDNLYFEDLINAGTFGRKLVKKNKTPPSVRGGVEK